MQRQEVSDSKNSKTFPMGNFLVAFVRHEPFFAHVISRLAHQASTDTKTAGVFVRNKRWYLLYNEEFLSSLPKEKCFGLFKHECYHLILDHCTNRAHSDKELWNIAADLAINSLIPVHELPDGALLPAQEDLVAQPTTNDRDIKRIVFEINTIFENLPPSQSAEYYYKALKEDKDLNRLREELRKKKFNLCGSESRSLIPIDHEGWKYENGENQIQGRLNKILQSAYEELMEGYNFGSLPFFISKILQRRFDYNMNWEDALRQITFGSRRGKKRNTYKRLNRKYPYIHPGKRYQPTANIAIYIDQSGSIHNSYLENLSTLLSELSQFVDFYTFHFDVDVDTGSEQHWCKNSSVQMQRTRSGGTSFHCIEKHFRSRPEFDTCWILTDGCAPKPPSCIKKRIWILFPKFRMPFRVDAGDSVVQISK